MQKRTYFVILLVAFSGLLFPPMSFAQNSLPCLLSIQLGGTSYSLDKSQSGQRIDTNAVYTSCIYFDPKAPTDEFGKNTNQVSVNVNELTNPTIMEPGMLPFCTDSRLPDKNSVGFTHSKSYTHVFVSGFSGTKISSNDVTSSFVEPFFTIVNNAPACDNQSKQPTQETTTEAPVSQQECGKMSNNVSANVVGIFGDVRILRDGNWFKATKGMDIYTCDVVKTSNDGRIRIELDDADEGTNSGPSVISVSPNSEVAVKGFQINYDENGEINQTGLLEMLYGTFHYFADGWGRKSIFTVDAGVALCGIRGSDMVFTYDPQQEKLSVFANEGEVSVKSQTAGNTKLVTAGQSVIVEKGHINPVTAMPDFAWQSAVSKTVLPETEQASAQELGETQLNEPMEDISPLQDSGGGCLVATATYGSELAPQVQQLRELRDSKLLQTESGAGFIESFNAFYYSFSPYIADYERQNPIFKEAVKLFITPMIASLSILNHVDMGSEAQVLGYGISLIILNLGMYVGIPAFAIISIRKRF